MYALLFLLCFFANQVHNTHIKFIATRQAQDDVSSRKHQQQQQKTDYQCYLFTSEFSVVVFMLAFFFFFWIINNIYTYIILYLQKAAK